MGRSSRMLIHAPDTYTAQATTGDVRKAVNNHKASIHLNVLVTPPCNRHHITEPRVVRHGSAGLWKRGWWRRPPCQDARERKSDPVSSGARFPRALLATAESSHFCSMWCNTHVPPHLSATFVYRNSHAAGTDLPIPRYSSAGSEPLAIILGNCPW
jgi:hypothetical protein